MSGFSDDFMAGAGDLFEMFGEPATVTGPGGAAQSVVVVASEIPSREVESEVKRDRVVRKTFDFDDSGVTGGPVVSGWAVTHDGVEYTVVSGARVPSGLWRCEAERRDTRAMGFSMGKR